MPLLGLKEKRNRSPYLGKEISFLLWKKYNTYYRVILKSVTLIFRQRNSVDRVAKMNENSFHSDFPSVDTQP